MGLQPWNHCIQCKISQLLNENSLHVDILHYYAYIFFKNLVKLNEKWGKRTKIGMSKKWNSNAAGWEQ